MAALTMSKHLAFHPCVRAQHIMVKKKNKRKRTNIRESRESTQSDGSGWIEVIISDGWTHGRREGAKSAASRTQGRQPKFEKTNMILPVERLQNIISKSTRVELLALDPNASRDTMHTVVFPLRRRRRS